MKFYNPTNNSIKYILRAFKKKTLASEIKVRFQLSPKHTDQKRRYLLFLLFQKFKPDLKLVTLRKNYLQFEATITKKVVI